MPRLLLLAVLAAGCSRPAPPSPEPAAAPPVRFRDHNLGLVSFDALQAAHVGAIGHDRDTTPTLDALARGGFSFARAYSVASWTVPASMTWFTGVYPSEHRMVKAFRKAAVLPAPDEATPPDDQPDEGKRGLFGRRR